MEGIHNIKGAYKLKLVLIGNILKVSWITSHHVIIIPKLFINHNVAFEIICYLNRFRRKNCQGD